jgi:hypothetical protein
MISPNKVTAKPEIIVVLALQKPANVSVGETINAIRVQLIADIYNDPYLPAILGPNGEIRYEGCETDLAKGKEMLGELTLSFSFVYPLLPSEL